MRELDDLEVACDALARALESAESETSTSNRARLETITKRLAALVPPPPVRPGSSGKTSSKQPREFDFARYTTRAIALHVAYLGWDYHGFASQGSGAAPPTVERALFNALGKTRLVASEHDVFSAADYSRCGRTDKGVSGLGQIVTLKVRSNGATAVEDELDYVALLNRTLPDDVRVLGWAPVDDELNARFDCKWRQYKYFFEKTSGLDVDAMRRAAALFEGVHDFRNFCRMDAENVKSFTRNVLECSIADSEDGKLMYIKVRGSAFLWHQVRCMASVLFMVGLGHEEPEIVTQLLDLEKTPRKPQYSMAPEQPLLLWKSAYDVIRLDVENMNLSDHALTQLETSVAAQMHTQRVRVAILEETWAHLRRVRTQRVVGNGIADITRDLAAVTCAGNVSVARSRHQRLRDRPTEKTFQERRERIEANANDTKPARD